METAQLIKQVKKECLKLLTRREHSRKEIETKLLLKGYQPEHLRPVLNELSAEKWQNDSRYAESYVRQRGSNGFGPVRIAYELQQRGIDAETATAAVNPEADYWFEQLQQVYFKKYAQSAVSDRSEKAKRIRFLAQRGFATASINALFKNTIT